MKKFLVDYIGSTGLVFETFATESELKELSSAGLVVRFRKLTSGEIMEIATYGFLRIAVRNMMICVK